MGDGQALGVLNTQNHSDQFTQSRGLRTTLGSLAFGVLGWGSYIVKCGGKTGVAEIAERQYWLT